MRYLSFVLVLLVSSALSACEVCQINAYRARNGQYGLIKDASLQAVAYARASRMAAYGYKGHVSGSYSPGRAEGVSWSTSRPNPERACYAMARGHRYVGAASVRGRDGWYSAVVFR